MYLVIKQLSGKTYFWFLCEKPGEVLAHSTLIDKRALVVEEAERVAAVLGLEDSVLM